MVTETLLKYIYIPINKKHYKIPLLACGVPAGFPSPADDYLEKHLDLNEHLIRHPAATFFMRVAGDSMTGAGIFSGDTLIVDRAVEPHSGSIVIAVVHNEFTVKRLRVQDGRLQLVSENPLYPALTIHDRSELTIWGTVTYVIHKP